MNVKIVEMIETKTFFIYFVETFLQDKKFSMTFTNTVEQKVWNQLLISAV